VLYMLRGVESVPANARPHVGGTESVLYAWFSGTGVCCCEVRIRGRGVLSSPASGAVLVLPTGV